MKKSGNLEGISFEDRCQRAKEILLLCLAHLDLTAEKDLSFLQELQEKGLQDKTDHDGNDEVFKFLRKIDQESSRVLLNASQDTMKVLWVFAQDVSCAIYGVDATAFAIKAIEHERRTR